MTQVQKRRWLYLALLCLVLSTCALEDTPKRINQTAEDCKQTGGCYVH